jgi:hypothetical protein
MPFYIHEDMDYISDMLRLRVSFKWRPLIDKNVTDTIRKWVESPASQRPYWILLSTVRSLTCNLSATDFCLPFLLSSMCPPKAHRFVNGDSGSIPLSLEKNFTQRR